MTKILIFIACFALITTQAQLTQSAGLYDAPLLSPTDFGATVETPTSTLNFTEYSALNNGHSFTVEVPQSHLNDAKNYGFALWVKASYLAPAFFNFEALAEQNLGIAGIYESGNDYCGYEIGKRALSVELGSSGFAAVPEFLFNTYSLFTRDNGDFSQEFPARQDYDHEWNFIYLAYSYEKEEVFSYVYFSNSDRVLTNTWPNQVKRWPLYALNFKLGGCDANGAAFQGQYSNVAFFYGGDTYYSTDINYLSRYRVNQAPAADVPQLTEMKTQEVVGGTPIDSLTSSEEQTDMILTGLNGVTEYSIWGWVKLNSYTQSRTDDGFNTLFRVSSDLPGETSDSADIGDRTLSAFVGQNTLQFSTYTFDWSATSSSKDYLQQVPTTESDLEQWFYVYFGYSQAQQEAFAFIKFNSTQTQLTWSNVYHMRADKLVLQFGNDDFHPTLDAKFQNWNFAQGPGAYFKQDFETYYSTAVLYESEVTTTQTFKEPAYYDSGFKETKSVYHYEVPQEKLGNVEDVSMSFWFKWNYAYPDYADVQSLKDARYPMSLAHVTETNNTGTNMGDRLLSSWLKPFVYGKKKYELSTYHKTAGRPNIPQLIEVRSDLDFDGAWGWLYFGYNRQTRLLFAYMRFQSGTTVIQTWNTANDHNYPPQALHLIVGKSSASPSVFNGQFFNVEFNYEGRHYLGTQQAVEQYYNGNEDPYVVALIKPNQVPVAYHDELIQGQDFKQFKDGPPVQGDVYSSLDGAGATEYAVWGWSKWTPTHDKSDKHIMFRLTTNKEDNLGDQGKPGDRTLLFYVGNGLITASTYNLNLIAVKPGVNDNAIEYSFQYEDDLESWYWVYFGYSAKNKCAYSYVQFYNNRIAEYKFPDQQLTHFSPYRFRFTLGDDLYMRSFNGEMTDFHFAYGVGAYKENNFKELIGSNPSGTQGLELDDTWQVPATVVNSFADELLPAQTITLTTEALAEGKGITEYSFSFWQRFGFMDPQKVDIMTVKNNKQAMAGVTELDGYNQAGLGAKALSLYLNALSSAAQPTYEFSTYSTNRNQSNDAKQLPFAEVDFESQWNWVYFGYSLNLQRATAYVYFGRTGLTKTLTWDQTVHNIPSALKFQLGKPQGDSAVGFNGVFFDVRFRTDILAYKESTNIPTYFASSVIKPPAYRPALTLLGLTNVGVINSAFYDADTNQVAANNLFEFSNNYRGAQEYAVYGWAKWSETTNRAETHTLFRLTTNTLSQAGDAATMGDRTLACFVYRNSIRFSTYRYQMAEVQDGQQDNELNHDVEYDDDLTSWFFVYFGYSKTDQKAKVFVKFQDREVTYTFDNVLQATGRYFGLYLAKDRFYPSFNGYLNQWVLSMGDGSYEESNYEPLYRIVEDTSDNKYYTQSTYEENTEKLTYLYEEEVPEDFLTGANMQTITGWTWFSWGFKVPRQFGRPSQGYGNCYQISRILYGVGKGVTADLCFSATDGSASVQFTETSGEVAQVISKPFLSYDDLDSSWNFVYMTHSADTSTTTVYVYFSNSGEKWVQTFDSATWSYESYVRFKLAGSSDPNKRFNGRFFDAQMSTFEKYSSQYVSEIQIIQSQITVTPSNFREDQLANDSDTISFTNQGDGEIQTTDVYNTAVDRHFIGYEGITTYSVRGWVRWVSNGTRNSSRLVHRIQQGILQDLTNDQQPGDRALALYLTADGFFEFSTYNYEGTDSNNSLTVKTEFNVSNLIGSWFFVYHGYSYIVKQSFMYLSFVNEQEFSQVIGNIRQFQSADFGMYLGRDSQSQSSAWNGSFNSWVFSAGSKSFVSTSAGARALRDITGTRVFNWVDVIPVPPPPVPSPVPVTSLTESILIGNQTTNQNVTNVIKQIGFDFKPATPRGRKNGSTLTNTDDDGEYDFSYFLGEDNINEPFAIEIEFDIPYPDENIVCFGYIPFSQIDVIKQNPNARYTGDSIQICSDGSSKSCEESPDCTNGHFDTTKGARYLWKFEEDKVIFKQQPTVASTGCTLISQDSVNGAEYQDTNDGLCYYDIIRYLNYKGPDPSPQYQCKFKREGKCPEAGTRDLLVPFVELRGKVSVKLIVDQFGVAEVMDTTTQPPCQNTTRVDKTLSEVVSGLCVPPPPPPLICNPPYEYRIYPDCTPTKCGAPYEDRVYPDCIPTPHPTPLCDPPNEDMVWPGCNEPIPPTPPPSKCQAPYEDRIYPDCTPTPTPPPPKCQAPYEDRIYPDCTPTPPTPPVPCTEEMPIQSCGTTVTPVPIIIPPASCDEFTTKNAENVQQLWQSEEGYASTTLVNPQANQLTYTSDSYQNGNANYQVTFPATTGSFCVGYHTKSDSNKVLAVCSNGTFYNYVNSDVKCQGSLKLDQVNTFAITVQANSVQVTTANQNYQCNINARQTSDGPLLPWVHYNYNADVSVHLQSTGGIDCPMEYTQETVDPANPTCNKNGQVQAWDYERSNPSYSEARFGVVDVTYLENDDENQFKVFFSPDTNALASYQVTLTRYREELAKYVCFGYINPVFEDAMRDTPEESRWTDTISVCTDTTTNNAYDNGVAYDGSSQCTGHFDDYQGAKFSVDITDTQVIIKQLNPVDEGERFVCNFNRDPTIAYVPWIEIDGVYAVEAPITGCTQFRPKVLECDKHFNNPADLDGTTWSNTIDFSTSTNGQLINSGQYASMMNKNANFKITVPAVTGRVCFGFISVEQWNNEISANYDVFWEATTYKICNDYDSINHSSCTGYVQSEPTTQFLEWQATVQGQSTQFTTSDHSFQCTFQRNGDTDDLLPWVMFEQNKGDGLSVELTGLGGMNCPINLNIQTIQPIQPIVTPDPGCIIVPPNVNVEPYYCPKQCRDNYQVWNSQEYNSESSKNVTGQVLEFPNYGGGQFWSQENAGSQYTIQINGDGANLCFGYATPATVALLEDKKRVELVNFENGIGVCLNGNTYNSGSDYSCVVTNELEESYSSLFYVYFTENSVKISDIDNYYSVECSLPANVYVGQLVPWVDMLDATKVTVDATCENPTFPVYEVCSQTWKSSENPRRFVNKDPSVNNIADFQSTEGKCVQNWSPVNTNKQFAVTFKNNEGSGRTCVGYIPTSAVDSLDKDVGPASDFTDYAVGFCTDDTFFNVFKTHADCRGSVSASLDQEFYVWKVANYVNVRSADDSYECQFVVTGDLVPWVQQCGEQSSVLTSITCEDPAYCGPTCDAWNDTSRVSQEWEKFQTAAYSFDEYLRNDGTEQVTYLSGINLNANYKITLNNDVAESNVCFGYVLEQYAGYVAQNPTGQTPVYGQAVGICSDNSTFNTNNQAIRCDGLENFKFDSGFGISYRSIVRNNTIQIFSITGDRGNFACTFDRNVEDMLVPWIQLGAANTVVAHFNGLGGNDCESAPHFCGYVPPPTPPPEKPECAYLYSECDYQGVSMQICGDEAGNAPQQCNGAILSIWLPPGAQVNLQCLEAGDVDCDGRSINLDSSAECLNQDTRLTNVNTATLVQSKKIHMTKITNNFEDLKEQIEHDKKQTQLSFIQIKNTDGDCVTLYSDCGFKGKSQQVCHQQESKVINSKSFTIPNGWSVEMFNDKEYTDQQATYSYDVDCLEQPQKYLKFNNKQKQITFFSQMSEHKQAHHLKRNRRM